MGKWYKSSWFKAATHAIGMAVVAAGVAVVVVAGSPLAGAVSAGYAAAYSLSLEEAVVFGSSLASLASTGVIITTAIAEGDPHKHPPNSIHGRPPGDSSAPDGDAESVGSNDPGTVIYPWDPAWGQDPYDDPVDVDEIPGVATSTNAGFKPPGAGSETETEKGSKHPFASRSGDFSGLVTTFLNPVTSRIIGYKGIPRKRKFSSLYAYSPFWRKHEIDFMASQRSTQTAS